MNANPTPQQAADLLSQVEANQSQARGGDAWPLVTLLFVLSTGLSVGLMAIGIIDDNTTQLVVAGAGLSWIIPALVVYLVKALSWSRRSTALLLTWLGVIILAFVAGVMADSFAVGGPIPFIAAGLLWVAAPFFSLLALRR
ncbi:hypothetical protein [Brevibacterium sp. 'Marine']|uniref:hypothetical protein n=1 Tax=unclassified Brevibacterium TaxID=2614124 RepID=UPI00145C764D|nr:hypothetical protein [Brevibacterium sp. 'Marine']